MYRLKQVGQLWLVVARNGLLAAELGRVVFFFLVAAFFAASAHALTLEKFRHGVQDQALKEITEDFLAGVGAGFGYANSRLGMKGQPLLFCQPSSLTLNAQNYIDLIESMARQYDFKQNQPVEVILLIGLEKEFPCK